MKIFISLFDYELNFCICKKSPMKPAVTESVSRPFIEEAVKEVDNPLRRVSESTKKNERTSISHFRNFIGESVTLKEITPEHIKAFEYWLAKNKVAPGASAEYMRSLRAVINRLGGNGKILFKEVSTGKRRTSKSSNNEEEIGKIETKEIKANTQECRARDTYLFSFYALGMPFADLVKLTTKNIHDGHIIYRRQKTGEIVSVPIISKMQEIINKYHQDGCPYLLPYLTNGKPLQNYRQYQNALRKYNRWLQCLSTKYDLPKLTSYTARRSWATIARKKGVDIHIIAKALGHTNPLTTLNYIKDIDYAEVDSASLVVIKAIKEAKPAA